MGVFPLWSSHSFILRGQVVTSVPNTKKVKPINLWLYLHSLGNSEGCNKIYWYFGCEMRTKGVTSCLHSQEECVITSHFSNWALPFKEKKNRNKTGERADWGPGFKDAASSTYSPAVTAPILTYRNTSIFLWGQSDCYKLFSLTPAAESICVPVIELVQLQLNMWDQPGRLQDMALSADHITWLLSWKAAGQDDWKKKNKAT